MGDEICKFPHSWLFSTQYSNSQIFAAGKPLFLLAVLKKQNWFLLSKSRPISILCTSYSVFWTLEKKGKSVVALISGTVQDILIVQQIKVQNVFKGDKPKKLNRLFCFKTDQKNVKHCNFLISKSWNSWPEFLLYLICLKSGKVLWWVNTKNTVFTIIVLKTETCIYKVSITVDW